MTALKLMHLSSAKLNEWGRVKTPDTERKSANQTSELHVHFYTNIEEVVDFQPTLLKPNIQ